MFITISLCNKEHNVFIQPLLKNVYFNKIESFENEFKKLDDQDNIFGTCMQQVSEKIAVEFEVLFEIENNIWKIPYVIILQKLYIKENLDLKYIYRKGRARLQRFDEIVVSNQQLHPFLLHALLLLDRSKYNYCLPEEFETMINENTFYFNNDLKYSTNKGCVYKVSQSFSQMTENYQTNIVLHTEEQVSFEGILIEKYNFKITKGFFYLNIFPTGFIDSHIEKFMDAKGKIVEPYHPYSVFDKTIEGNLERFNTEYAFTKGDKLFQGSYEQCLIFLKDKNNIAAIKKATSQKNSINLNIEGDYYNRISSGNPWTDVFGEGDEADTAYWNTD